MTSLRVLLLVSFISPVHFPQSAAQTTSEFIFAPNSQPFTASHASTLVELKGSNLLAAWFAGTAEGTPDVGIWASLHTPKGWSAPAELVREPGIACWNPVLFHTADGRLWLFYKFGPNPSSWTAARMHSEDEGRSWSPTEHLPAGLIGPVRAKPLLLPDGTIVSGSSVESFHAWAVWIERSTDNASTWTKIGPILSPSASATQPPAPEFPSTRGIIQPSVVRLDGTHLRLYARSTEELARVVIADSLDNGITWTPARALDVPNPNSGIDTVALKDGRVVLVYNNTPKGRSPLNLAISADGEHFRPFRTLEDQPGEFSYPALIQTSAGDLELTYTWNRQSIRHVHLSLADVPAPGARESPRR